MINIKDRLAFSESIRGATNKELLESFKEIDRKTRSLISEVCAYQNEETLSKVMELSELEYKRKIVVDMIIGKAVI